MSNAMSMWPQIAEQISAASGVPFAVRSQQSVGGGCINATYLIADGARRYFVKLNDADRLDMFVAEAEGLEEMARSNTLRVPQPVSWGVAGGQSFLALEYLDLSGSGGHETLARNLAAMHHTVSEAYGWHRDNTIGSTPQPNEWNGDWLTFLRERRIGYQLDLALEHGGQRMQQRGEQLLERMGELFGGYAPVASLLHGDLWAGNWAATPGGEPVVFDPAVYFGDREADIAMTELFGGFGPRFYAAYNEAWPLDAGYKVRKELYNLYHVLNHYNMFGGGYGRQAEGMIDRLLAELR